MDTGPMPKTEIIYWSFLDRQVSVFMLSDKVAYSFTCDPDEPHNHDISCLWVWHNCSMSIVQEKNPEATPLELSSGWKPAGVGAHELKTIEPLHIEPSVYWSECCGMHGWIRNGVYSEV